MAGPRCLSEQWIVCRADIGRSVPGAVWCRCHSLDCVPTVTNTPGRAHVVVERWRARGAEVDFLCTAEGRTFRESFRFPGEVGEPVAAVLDLLAMVAAVSYAKAFAPCIVEAPEIALTSAGRALVESAFAEGMAEFAHTTGIVDPILLGDTAHRPAAPIAPPVGESPGRPLIPVGGGRDSCVVATALDALDPILLSVGGSDAARRVASRLGSTLVVVDRTIDPAVLELNAAGAPNGHIPITAITMLASIVSAGLLGSPVVVMANEASASNPTRIVDGRAINHQHSKSLAFEMLLVAALHSIGSSVACVSALRNRTDTEIARVFAVHCTPLHAEFVSCNRAGVRDASRRSARWCGACAKCRSITLSLAPHMTPAALTAILGVDLLDDPSQVEGFADLLDEERKPFECVQTVDEARAAIGVLASSSVWSNHAVVGHLAHSSGPAPLAGPAREGSHGALGDHVPLAVREAMDGIFA